MKDASWRDNEDDAQTVSPTNFIWLFCQYFLFCLMLLQ